MFFFFPYGTDCPVFYWPYATVGLIVVNTLLFFGIGLDPSNVTPDSPWLLAYASGIRPEQWFGSRFMHGDIFHLFFNMLALWLFGIVVEGKLGPAKFLSVYLLIAITQAAAEQVAMLGYQGAVPGSLGASAAIYGIMAIAAIWAPFSGILFFYFYMVYFIYRGTGSFAIPVGTIAALFVGSDFLWALLCGTGAATSVLHLMGAMVGYPIGLLLLKRKAVDCDGRDLFSQLRVMIGPSQKELGKKKTANAKRAKKAEKKELQALAEAKQQFDVFLSQKVGGAALALFHKFRDRGDGWRLDAPRLQALVACLQAEQRWNDLGPLLLELIELSPERADGLRVSLAQLCVMKLERPGRALELLSEADPAALNDKQRQVAAAVTQRAQQLQAEGIIEFDDNEW